MQENNNLGTNQGSSLYGESASEIKPDADGNSVVYDEQFQSDTAEQERVSETSEPIRISKEVMLKKEDNPSDNTPQCTGNVQSAYGNNQLNNIQQNAGNIQSSYMNSQSNNIQQNANNIPPIYTNNQQNNQQWGGYQNQPPQNNKPKKKGVAIFVGIMAAIAAALIIVLVVFFSRTLFTGKNPKEQVKKGMEDMVREMEDYKSSISEDIGIDALEKLRENTPVHTDINFSFNLPYYEDLSGFDRISIGLDAISDIGNRKASCDVSVGMYGFNMSVGNIVVAKDTIYVGVPLLYDDIYSVDLANFGRDFNNSAWADFLEMEIPEDQKYSFFDSSETISDSDKYDAELKQMIEKYSTMIEDATEFKVVSKQKEFKVGDKTINCKVISQIIDKDAYNEMISGINKDIKKSDFYTDILKNRLAQSPLYYGYTLDELREEVDQALDDMMSMQLEQDFVLNYYLDNKGRIVNISTPDDIIVNNSDIKAISVDIDFMGEERVLDKVDGGIYFQTDDEVLYFGIEREASVTDEMYSEEFSILLQDDSHISDIKFDYWNDWSYKDKSYNMRMSLDTMDSSIVFSSDGGFSNIVNGESYTFRINKATLNIDGRDLIDISGTIEVEPTDDEIEIPTEAVDLLDMDEQEIEYFLFESDLLIG